MAGNGPLPNPHRRRRNAPTIPTTNLPARGRRGRIPKCPYDLGPSGSSWWRWAWRTPQSAAWSSGNLWTVGRRAVLEDRAEPKEATVLREMRELDDRLGLTPKGMAALRWSIVDDSLNDKADEAHRAQVAAVNDELARARADRRGRIGA